VPVLSYKNEATFNPPETVVVPVRLIEKTVVVPVRVEVATAKSVCRPSLAPACIENFAYGEVVPMPTRSVFVFGYNNPPVSVHFDAPAPTSSTPSHNPDEPVIATQVAVADAIHPLPFHMRT
jgi:hypothetical protein